MSIDFLNNRLFEYFLNIALIPFYGIFENRVTEIVPLISLYSTCVQGWCHRGEGGKSSPKDFKKREK